jgi:hypothetical protein
MIVSKLQAFIDSPLTKAADAAAVVTGTATAAAHMFPDFRESLHDWALVFVDIAPIATVFWLLIQGVCKIIVTYHTVTDSGEGEE